MTKQSHGGRRLGSGRPRVTDVQLTARVSSDASKVIQAYGSDGSFSEWVRNMADFSSAATGQPSPDKPVYVSFHRLAASHAETFDDAYQEIVKRLLADGGRPVVYSCGRDLLTVKVRIPLGNHTSLWLYVPGRRLERPTEQEYRADVRKIQNFLEEAGLSALWVPDAL